MSVSTVGERSGVSGFGPENPFYLVSELPFQAPPFDQIKDSDYQPAIEAGMAEQLAEIRVIAESPEAPTFENTIVAMEKTGCLLQRTLAAFHGVAGAHTNPELERIQREEAPRLAANRDAIYLNGRLFERVAAVYDRREGLSGEALRLAEICYKGFVRAGAKLSEAEKDKLKKLNEEESTLTNEFRSRVLAASNEAAYGTTEEAALAGLSVAQKSAAAGAAKAKGKEGWMLPLQNTTQQPYLSVLRDRKTREEIFANSWARTERGDANDTREIVVRLAKIRATKAKLLGFESYAAWKLEDQMARTPQAAIGFLDALVPATLAMVEREAKEIQAAMGDGAELKPWDWEFYSEAVRKAKYDLDEEQLRPYFELNRVLEEGVFYAARKLYGIEFKERTDIPVWHEEVRAFEVSDANGQPLALFYCDLFKRESKNGGAWMSSFVRQSKLMGTLPVVYNVSNVPKPAEGEPALIGFGEVTTLFHEFGHALHAIFSECEYPSLSGTSVARDFVEFPSQFNEHWATHPEIFARYARHYETGAAMPKDLIGKMKLAAKFNQGYRLTELLAAAELDMEWHSLGVEGAPESAGGFERAALEKKKLALGYVPPRYRSTYFAHIWSGSYGAGYYAYLWSEMLDSDAFRWFEEHGGLSRENGDRLRRMVLSRGNTADPAEMFRAWLGRAPEIEPMLKGRGLM